MAGKCWLKDPELENLRIINLIFFNICDALPFTLFAAFTYSKVNKLY